MRPQEEVAPPAIGEDVVARDDVARCPGGVVEVACAQDAAEGYTRQRNASLAARALNRFFRPTTKHKGGVGESGVGSHPPLDVVGRVDCGIHNNTAAANDRIEGRCVADLAQRCCLL